MIIVVFVAAAVLAGIYLYPRERQAVSEATGAPAALFKDETSINGDKKNMDTNSQLTAILHTSEGDITIELYPDKAPATVANFVKLAKEGFYNGTLFHRVIKGFMIQGGDPNTKTAPANWNIHGTGGPGYKFDDEKNDLGLGRGILAMANSGPNTNGSQFFIMTARTPMQLAGYYTSFGKVVGDMGAVDKIEATPIDHDRNDHPTVDMVINSVEIK
jgi:peptidyl-prolyl cis-trans isomerase B (cyclophilin B)